MTTHLDLLPLLEDPDPQLRDDMHRLNRERADAIDEVDRVHRGQLVAALREAAARRAETARSSVASGGPRLRPAPASSGG